MTFQDHRRPYGPYSAIPQEVDPGARSAKAASAMPNPRQSGMFGSGMLGAIGRFLTPERMQTIGATMRQVSGDRGALDQLSDRRRQAGLDAERSQDRNRERKDDDDQRAALAELIAGLTPEQRLMARANPQAFIERMLRPAETGRIATSEEAAGLGFEPGTVVWIDQNGQPQALQRPRAPSSQGGQYPDDGYDYE